MIFSRLLSQATEKDQATPFPESQTKEQQESLETAQEAEATISAEKPAARTLQFSWLDQEEESLALNLSLYAGFTFSKSTYQKALNYSFDSIKLPAWSAEAQLRIKNFYLEGDFKSLPGQVHSSEGLLNVYGWRYRHLWASAGMGYLIDNKHQVSIKGVFHYVPMLFPTQVGVFHSEAAFEKVGVWGAGLGYKSDFSLNQMPFRVQLDVFYLNMNEPGYDLNYGVAWNFRLTRYHRWRNIKLGISYDQLGQVLSLTELYTGQNYPFKSFVRLHQLLLHVEAPLF